jgi:hypothetical protein
MGIIIGIDGGAPHQFLLEKEAHRVAGIAGERFSRISQT